MTRRTSKEAYQRIQEQGVLPKRRWAVYDALFHHGPATAGELTEKMKAKKGGRHAAVSARLTELRQGGFALEVEERECRVTSHTCIVFDVTDHVPTPAAYGPGGVMRSSKREDWRTPPWLFEMLDEEFGFDLDAAALSKNALCGRYIHPKTDGLAVDWHNPRAYSIRPDVIAAVKAGTLDLDTLRAPARSVFVNPPWSKRAPIGPWIEKLVIQSKGYGQTIVANAPANTDVS